MIGLFAEFVEIGEARFCPDTFFQVVFGNFSKSGFDGLQMAFRIEELLAEGCQPMGFGLLNFGEFCVDDSEGFGFGGDLGMLGLELGEEGLQVCDRALYFWVIGILVLSANLIAMNSTALIDGSIACVEGADVKAIVHG